MRVRVANLLPYVVLKINAFQDRHANKDAYDLVFCLRNYRDEVTETGRTLAASPVARVHQVTEALVLLAERFAQPENDGPSAYAAFLGDDADEDARAQLRLEAVAVVREFFRGFRA